MSINEWMSQFSYVLSEKGQVLCFLNERFSDDRIKSMSYECFNSALKEGCLSKYAERIKYAEGLQRIDSYFECLEIEKKSALDFIVRDYLISRINCYVVIFICEMIKNLQYRTEIKKSEVNIYQFQMSESNDVESKKQEMNIIYNKNIEDFKSKIEQLRLGKEFIDESGFNASGLNINNFYKPMENLYGNFTTHKKINFIMKTMRKSKIFERKMDYINSVKKLKILKKKFFEQSETPSFPVHKKQKLEKNEEGIDVDQKP